MGLILAKRDYNRSDIDTFTGHPLWSVLVERMELQETTADSALEKPGEFEHGKAIGMRKIATAVVNFPKILEEELN